MSQALVLEGVRPELGQQPDAATLVAAEIDDDAAAGVADLAKRGLQLFTAVAAPRTQRVPGQALGVDAHQRRRAAARTDVAEHQGNVLGAVRTGEAEHREAAVLGGQGGLHEALGAARMDLRHAHIPIHVIQRPTVHLSILLASMRFAAWTVGARPHGAPA